MKTSKTRETVIGAIGGVAIGYVLWLVAISIGDNATAGQWGPLVLVLSVVLGVGAGAWGWWLRRRDNHLWSAFAFGLPILPVALTLAVLADIYV
jgi:lipopolysaccharide export LptBFGC system permease protein LptF